MAKAIEKSHGSVSNKIDMKSLDPFATGLEIVQYEQSNPFFLSYEGSKHKFTKTKFLADEYKNVYVLCLDDQFEKTPENINRIKLFMSPTSDVSELSGQAGLVTLVQGAFSLVNVQSIRSGLVSIEKNILEIFNHQCYELRDKELVYCMLNFKKTDVTEWLKIYRTDSSLDSFIRKKIFYSYNNIGGKKTEDDLLNIINGVGDFKYWEDDHNCKLSINNAFCDRKFNLKTKWNLPTEEIEKELQELLKNFSKNKTKNTNYPEELTNPQPKPQEEDPLKMNPFVDGSKLDHRSYFEIVNKSKLSLDSTLIKELLMSHSLSEKEKYYLLCNILVSKNYCHYVINDADVLRANKELFNKYSPIFRYLIGYAWVSLYMEESIRKTKMIESDRFVFDLETASELPVFPYVADKPQLNPYMSVMVSDTNLNSTHNMHGVKQSVTTQQGIVDITEFKRRFNIFTTGKADKNIFEGVDFGHMVVTGGCMAAILPKYNPLMSLFEKDTKKADPKNTSEKTISDSDFNRFCEEYYANSDIDVACNHSNILDFIAHVKDVHTKIIANLGLPANSRDVNLVPTKTLGIYINAEILKEKCDSGEIPFEYKFIIENKNNPRVRFYFYNMYLKEKEKGNIEDCETLKEKVDDEAYFEFIKYVNFENITLIINTFSFENQHVDNKMPENNSGLHTIYNVGSRPVAASGSTNEFVVQGIMEEEDDSILRPMDKESSSPNVFIRFSETLKYKIESRLLKHSIEMFRINFEPFFSCIARFHLPCVRSYYNGKTCYMVPSAITAYHTLTNIDFKYFVGSKDPVKIINKYRQRGYGIILNKTEINQVLSYLMVVDNHKAAYGIKDKEIKNIIGSLDINHEFFKPRKNVPNEFTPDPNIKTDYVKVALDYIATEDHYLNTWAKKSTKKYSPEFLQQRTIGADGHIAPVKKWMIDASYDLLC
jgi:hypothetical protein